MTNVILILWINLIFYLFLDRKQLAKTDAVNRWVYGGIFAVNLAIAWYLHQTVSPWNLGDWLKQLGL